ncbi:MAG TPA: MFS transporter [Caulobacteraceae bacterium]|jgi:MFS family permease
MAFFGNDAVNRVNLHTAIEAIAMTAGGIFFLAFLLHAGLSVPLTLLSFAGVLAGRFALRPLMLPLGKRWGLKPMVIAGTVLQAVQYPMLAGVHGLNGWLYAFCLAQSVGDIFYWPAYHAYFAALGDAEHRGHQVAMREALGAGVGIVAPLLGAWAIVSAGPWIVFSAIGAVQALSALPLLAAPNVKVAASAPGAFRAARMGMAIFVTDGWQAGTFYFIWQIALFLSLGRSLTGYGGAMALAAVVGAVGGLVIGRHIDRGNGRRAVVIAYASLAAVIVLRAASVGSPWLALAANACGPLVAALLLTAEMTAVYNMAKASPCPYRFHLASEAGWDVGCLAATLIAAGLSAAGASLAWPMLLGVPCAAIAAGLLWRYYTANPMAGGVEVPIERLTEPAAPI